ncbi:hypothetical protein [Streptomyces sp. NPDC056707]|uniref:hypothetical protein n=1 Tax=Streptomyces sp. NPDC056707 TaxID=3345919 RepID=UPI0036817EAB
MKMTHLPSAQLVTEALLSTLPGATSHARVTIEQPHGQHGHRDTWTGTAAGLADRIATVLADGYDAQQKDTPAPAGAAFTAEQATPLLYDAITTFQLTAQLTGLRHAHIRQYLAEALASALAAASPATPLTVYRAAHDSIPFGLYTTEAAARAHCEFFLSSEYPAHVVLVHDWIGDESEPEAPWELVATVNGGDEQPTGYTVTALEAAAEFDPDAEQ